MTISCSPTLDEHASGNSEASAYYTKYFNTNKDLIIEITVDLDSTSPSKYHESVVYVNEDKNRIQYANESISSGIIGTYVLEFNKDGFYRSRSFNKHKTLEDIPDYTITEEYFDYPIIAWPLE